MDQTISGLEGVVCIHGSHVGSLDRQTHILIWKLFSTLWPPMVLPSTLKNAFLQSPPWKFLAARFWQQDQPPRPGMPPKSILAPPPLGHQATAAFSRQGKLLLPFLAKLSSGVVPFNGSPKRGAHNVGVDRHDTRGFPKCKTPTSLDGTPLTFLPPTS